MSLNKGVFYIFVGSWGCSKMEAGMTKKNDSLRWDSSDVRRDVDRSAAIVKGEDGHNFKIDG